MDKKQVIECCKNIVGCLVDSDYLQLQKMGALRNVQREDLERVLLEYDPDDRIIMPSDDYFQQMQVHEYNDQSGYWVDIDLWYSDGQSDLTLQLEIKKSGDATIEDLHVL